MRIKIESRFSNGRLDAVIYRSLKVIPRIGEMLKINGIDSPDGEIEVTKIIYSKKTIIVICNNGYLGY